MKQPARRTLFSLLLLLLAPTVLRADLAGEIRTILGDKSFHRAAIGIEILRLGDAPGQGQVLYELDATTPRIPASNLKLVTTATALKRLGADFQFKTILAGRGSDIALVGDGDPSLGDAEMLRKLGWSVDTVFKNWAQMLKSRGIVEVHDVLVDDSIFDQNFMHPDWPADQQHKRYVAQVGGVNLNANCVDFFLRVHGYGQIVDYFTDPATSYLTIRNTCVMGEKNAVWLARQLGTNDVILRGETNVSNDEPVSVTVQDPPMFAATVLAETLSANGIRVSGQVQRDRTIRTTLANAEPAPTSRPSPTRWTTLAVHSTPLSAVLARANKDSMNLYAEALCKRIGAAASGTSGSWENGTAATSALLLSLGIGREQFNLVDGCGLSKKDTISPHAIVKLLEYEFHDKDRAAFMGSLAVGGVDGTLDNRFKDDLKGRVFGKSGYVAGVRSLSGYLKGKDGRWYTFSILMNSLFEGDLLAKPAQEKIVRAIER